MTLSSSKTEYQYFYNNSCNLVSKYFNLSFTSPVLGRSDGVSLTVDGQLCHVFQTPPFDLSQTFCDTQLTGQTIRLSKNHSKDDDDYYITVCEVEVWGKIRQIKALETKRVGIYTKDDKILKTSDHAQKYMLPDRHRKDTHTQYWLFLTSANICPIALLSKY